MRKILNLGMTIFALACLAACGQPNGVPGAEGKAGTTSAVPQVTQSTFNPLPTWTTLPTLTPVAVPTVRGPVDTNCRRGPGTSYAVSATLTVGQAAEVLGRDAAGRYWLIRTPQDPASLCWLWGAYASISGAGGLPVLTPGPGFNAAYLDTTVCGGQYALRFKLTNTGSLAWESLRIDVTDDTTHSSFTHTRNGFKDYDGCPPKSQQKDLLPGENVDVTAADLGQMNYDPMGHALRAVVTLCTQTGRAGECITQTLDIIP